MYEQASSHHAVYEIPDSQEMMVGLGYVVSYGLTQFKPFHGVIQLDETAKMNKEENETFVFSTHDQRVIDKARRVITLEDGKVLSDVSK